MSNKIEQIVSLTAEGPFARRLIIYQDDAGGSWINFEIQQYINHKWVSENPSYAFLPKYVKNIPDAITKVLNEKVKK